MKPMRTPRGTARRIRRDVIRPLWQQYNAGLHTDKVISLAAYMRLPPLGTAVKL